MVQLSNQFTICFVVLLIRPLSDEALTSRPSVLQKKIYFSVVIVETSSMFSLYVTILGPLFSTVNLFFSGTAEQVMPTRHRKAAQVRKLAWPLPQEGGA